MKDLEPVETQLLRLPLRNPSRRLARKIFSRRSKDTHAPALRHWLAPAMASVLFTLLLLNHQADLGPPTCNQPIFAMILSNQSYAAYLPGSFQREQNRWDTFGWTNQGHSRSSVGPFPRP